MKILTSHLTGAALNWVVTKLQIQRRDSLGEHTKTWFREQVMAGERYDSYSADWLWGGPLIERERINAFSVQNGESWAAQNDARTRTSYGATILIAAMRCYVASNLGDEVDVPDEII